LKAEDDTATVTLDGQVVEIEKNDNDNSLSFDGVDDYVSIPHSSNLSLTNFTIETWVNPSQIKNAYQPLITKEASNGYQRNYGLFIRPNDLRVNFSFVDGNGSTWRGSESQNSLKINEWNHIAMTYDGSKFNFYLNGILDTSINLVTTVYQNTEPVKIGRELAEYTPFTGKMDEVRIWNQARTQAEIQADMNHQLTGTETGLVGYWQFNESTGNTVTDLAGNDNNGTILGGASFTAGVFSPGTFVFSQPNFTVKEGGIGVKEVTINRVDGLGGEASVTVDLSDGIGVSAADYDNTPIVVNFANGETTKTVSIPVKTDTVNDAGETINLTLTNATNGASIGSQSTASVMIVEDAALSFDGVNDYVEIKAHQNSTNITVEAWAKSNTPTWNNYGNLVSKRNAFILSPVQGSKDITFYIHNGTNWSLVNYTPGSNFDITQWHHYAGTYDGANLRLYVDGQEAKVAQVNAGAINVDSGVLIIGNDDGQNRYFNGKIDEVRIWNTARSAEEIQSNYAQQLTGNETGLVGYWQFDEGSGNIVNDLSANNNDGTIYGATFTSGVFIPGTFVFSQPNFDVTESGNSLTKVTINRIDGLGGEVSVTVNLSDGLATATDDYDDTPIVVNFANGETSKTVTIPIVDDFLPEGNETINLALKNPTGNATIGGQSTATLTIRDNDTPILSNFNTNTDGWRNLSGESAITWRSSE
jgi:hypothetical protein